MKEQMSDSSQSRNIRAREAALAAVDKLPVESTSLVKYQSRGRVVVVGGMEALEFAPRLSTGLQPQVLLTEGVEEPGVPVIPIAGRTINIEGYLGAFKIQLGEAGSPNTETVAADLVLDLSPTPLLSMPMKPPGYFTSATDEQSLDNAVDELSGLTGSFEKPLYFAYDPSICAHGRSGQIACNRCIDACPAEAIRSLIESVEVNSYLCQGGGVCASVCPSGAIRYSYPDVADTLARIRTLLRIYREHGGQNPAVVFVADADGRPPALKQANLLPVMVEELASVGLEVWLSALAYGAQTVLLVDGGSMSRRVCDALKDQFAAAADILDAMGYPREAIRVTKQSELTEKVDPTMPLIDPAGYYGTGGKRQIAYMAIDHLYEQAAQSRPMVNLSTGAPFGAAYIEEKSCTLCLACIGVCPGKALQGGQGLPQVRFIEANCLQCGMCTRTCPEDAIWITPRLLFDRSARGRARVLYEEAPFCCTACGKPFATRSVIDKMLAKLQGHWMFQNERARNRLTMCDDCRVVDIMQDADAMDSVNDGQTLQ
jgi:ferredoxin